MTLEDFKDIWNYAVAGPQLLLVLRMATLLPVGMYAVARWYSLFYPAAAGEADNRWVRVVIRIGLALGATILSLYFFLSGVLEFDRVSTPVRLVVANVGQVLFFWSLFMLWILNRMDYWAADAGAKRKNRRATDRAVNTGGGACPRE